MFATSLAALMILVPAPKTDLPQNPLRRAKAGDWVEYTTSISVQGNNIEGRMRMTVTDITEKAATVETKATLNGMDAPVQKQTIDLTKDYGASLVAQLGQNNPAVKIEKVAEGKDKINHRGKDYECAWVTVKLDAPGGLAGQELKIWLHQEAPLLGVLKMEMKVKEPAVAVIIELSGSGGK